MVRFKGPPKLRLRKEMKESDATNTQTSLDDSNTEVMAERRKESKGRDAAKQLKSSSGKQVRARLRFWKDPDHLKAQETVVTNEQRVTGERFVLLRSQNRRRHPQSVDAPSFAGGGVRGRGRYLVDSLLRLTRDRTFILVLLVVVALYYLAQLLQYMNGTVHSLLAAYRIYAARQFAPFTLMADFLTEFAPNTPGFASLTKCVRRSSTMLDANIPFLVPKTAFIPALIGKLFKGMFAG